MLENNFLFPFDLRFFDFFNSLNNLVLWSVHVSVHKNI